MFALLYVRLVHVKMLADVSESIGFDQFYETIIPLLEPLSKDVEPVVKQHLVEQVKHLAKVNDMKLSSHSYTLSSIAVILEVSEDTKLC